MEDINWDRLLLALILSVVTLSVVTALVYFAPYATYVLFSMLTFVLLVFGFYMILKDIKDEED